MAKGKSIKFPVESIRRVVFFLVVLLAITFVLIWPRHNNIIDLENRIAGLEIRLEEQKTLYPFYMKLNKRLKENTIGNLPFPEKTKIPRYDIDRIALHFHEIASRTNMHDILVAPDVNSIGKNKDLMLVNVSGRGRFNDFHAFLREAGGLSFLEQIEQVNLKHVPGDREFKLKVWARLEL